MSYKLITMTAMRSDVNRCPQCGVRLLGGLPAKIGPVIVNSCHNDHAWFYLETVTGPTTGGGEVGYWVQS